MMVPKLLIKVYFDNPKVLYVYGTNKYFYLNDKIQLDYRYNNTTITVAHMEKNHNNISIGSTFRCTDGEYRELRLIDEYIVEHIRQPEPQIF